jgi:hypothetical protein
MKFRLKSAHYLENDIYLPGDTEMSSFGDEKGTVVGDGTPYPIVWPTLEMEPLDEEAEAFLEKEKERLRMNDASTTPIDDLPMDKYEENYIPAFNRPRRPPLPAGSPVKK